MKLQFDPSLAYQQEAIAAVCDVFQGQTAKPALFTVAENLEEQFSKGQDLYGAHQGVGNRLHVADEDLLKNVRTVQARHGLPLSEHLDKKELHFDIEMETDDIVDFSSYEKGKEIMMKYGVKL